MNHKQTLDGLDLAAAFLRAHPDVPTPQFAVAVYDGLMAAVVTASWHLNRRPHDAALEILRAFPGESWERHKIEADTAAYKCDVHGIELVVYAKAHAAQAPQVNLLDALAEVSA